MGGDPLDTSLARLLGQTGAILRRMAHDPVAARWLTHLGQDPAALTGRLRTLEADGLRARMDGIRAHVKLALARRQARGAAAATLAWTRRVRQLFTLAARVDPGAEQAAGRIHKLQRLRMARFAGALAELRRVLPELRHWQGILAQHQGELDLLGDGEALLVHLERLDRVLAKATWARRTCSARTERARLDLTSELRIVRRKWRLAHDVSGGLLPDLAWTLVKAELGRRRRARRVAAKASPAEGVSAAPGPRG